MPSIDDFAGSPAQNVGVHHPATGSEAVVPDTPLARVSRGLYVGTGGHVSITLRDGSTNLYKNVQSGTMLPLRVQLVNSAGTTASDMVAVR